MMKIAAMIMTRTTNIKTWLRAGLLVSLFAFIIGYTFFRTQAVAKGVALVIEGLSDGWETHDQLITLTGTATHATHLLVNGHETAVDEENRFVKTLALSPGYNIITVEARDRFEQTTRTVYRVLYQEAEAKTSDL